MEQLFATPVGKLELVVRKLLPYLGLGVVAVLLVLAVGAWCSTYPCAARWCSSRVPLSCSWSARASIAWSPDEAWRAGLRAEEVQAERALTAADREQLRDRIRAEVIEAHAAYRAARTAIAASADAGGAAEEEYRARVSELRAGRAVSTEVLEADLGLSRARRQLLDSVTEARVARARLTHATGAFAR